MPKIKSNFSISTSNLDVMYKTGFYKCKIKECDRILIEKFVKIEEEYSYANEIVYYINKIKLRKLN